MNKNKAYEDCRLCPRDCGANRYEKTGCCGCGPVIKAARAALHQWEEPCISGVRGSGTVFFTGCALGCCFCQNYPISQEGFGKELTPSRLAEIFLKLQEKGAHNINLVTASQYLPSIIEALDLAKPLLTIPVVYNTGGYERPEVIKALKNYVDIWLPDLKYYGHQLSSRYSKAPDYFSIASQAVKEMIVQTGEPVIDPISGLMKKGVLIRHMVLPGAKDDSIKLLQWISSHLPRGQFYISLLSQYTPFYKSSSYPEINRRITSYEYNQVVETAIKIGLIQGFMQKKSSAKEEYTPPFDLEGI